MVAGTSLPVSLLKKFEEYLEQADVLDRDVNLHLFLSPQETSIGERSPVNMQRHSRPKLSRCLSVDALTFLHDLGCPQDIEQEIVQIELLDPLNRFLSYFSGELVVYETIFARPTPSHELLYNVRILHCFRDNHAFAKLVGVVTNKSRTQLKSYLIELPKAQSKVQYKMQVPGITWDRREKWARQLVEGVFQVHNKDFVIGDLLSFWDPVIIDETDCVHFWHFTQKFVVGVRDTSC